jgi:hypothetical protein
MTGALRVKKPLTREEIFRRKKLHELKVTLCKIANERDFEKPDLQACLVRNKLLNRIERVKQNRFRDWHYSLFVKPSMTERRTYGGWIPHLIERATKKRKATKAVKQRAIELLRGEAKKPKKNLIEERAIRLAEVVKQEWFLNSAGKGRPKGERKPDAKIFKKNSDGLPIFGSGKIPTAVIDIIRVAAPVIEEFAQKKIGSRGDPFDALFKAVEAYSTEIVGRTSHRETIISRVTVGRAIARMRRDFPDTFG